MWAAGVAGAVSLAICVGLLPVAAALCGSGLAAAMAAIAIADIDDFTIPDAISFPALVAGLLVPFALTDSGDASMVLYDNLVAAAIYGSAFYLLAIAYRAIRGFDGLGLGDVKLAAVAGAWTGLAGANLVVLISCFAAISVVLVASLRGGWMRDRKLPFGAFLAPAIWLVWVAQQAGWLA